MNDKADELHLDKTEFESFDGWGRCRHPVRTGGAGPVRDCTWTGTSQLLGS
ncbi:hypothetical protein ACFVS9_29990 [Streptomyces sp. NPDC058008]|uniref:hypothetical protein n=1 Tax=Streptomyces sp. NPDC058008 TaxID=3346303 RepID=UPI0036E3E761